MYLTPEKIEELKILERLTEPDQIVIFRVNWEDDHGNFRANRSYRVQHNNAIGPYKGGIRFHRDLTLDTLKFLAFEQTLKNVKRGRVHESADKYGVEFHKDQRPLGVPCDLSFPCATQNEINGDDAKILIRNGCIAVAKGAKMPTMQAGVDAYHEAKVIPTPCGICKWKR